MFNKIDFLIFRFPAVGQNKISSRDYQYEVKRFPIMGKEYITLKKVFCFYKICLMFEDKVDIRPS